jgi:hypothetical protein
MSRRWSGCADRAVVTLVDKPGKLVARPAGGKIAEERLPPPGTDQPYPNLATALPKPERSDSAVLPTRQCPWLTAPTRSTSPRRRRSLTRRCPVPAEPVGRGTVPPLPPRHRLQHCQRERHHGSGRGAARTGRPRRRPRRRSQRCRARLLPRPRPPSRPPGAGAAARVLPRPPPANLPGAGAAAPPPPLRPRRLPSCAGRRAATCCRATACSTACRCGCRHAAAVRPGQPVSLTFVSGSAALPTAGADTLKQPRRGAGTA